MTRPYTERETIRRIGQTLDKTIDDRTWTRLRDQMNELELTDFDMILAWVVERGPRVLDALASVYAAEHLVRLAFEAISTHHGALRLAWRRWNAPDDDWEHVRRDVYYDLVDQKHYMRVRIDKTNGELVVLHGTASSLMGFVTALVRGFAAVGTPTAFTESAKADYIDTVVESLRMLDVLDDATDGGVAAGPDATMTESAPDSVPQTSEPGPPEPGTDTA